MKLPVSPFSSPKAASSPAKPSIPTAASISPKVPSSWRLFDAFPLCVVDGVLGMARYQRNRAVSIASLLLLTLAISVVDRCGSPRIAGQRFIRLFSAHRSADGRRWPSTFSLVFAEDNCRRYPLMGAAGLCYFYGISIGELP